MEQMVSGLIIHSLALVAVAGQELCNYEIMVSKLSMCTLP